jgi:hypothetical protein
MGVQPASCRRPIAFIYGSRRRKDRPPGRAIYDPPHAADQIDHRDDPQGRSVSPRGSTAARSLRSPTDGPSHRSDWTSARPGSSTALPRPPGRALRRAPPRPATAARRSGRRRRPGSPSPSGSRVPQPSRRDRGVLFSLLFFATEPRHARRCPRSAPEPSGPTALGCRLESEQSFCVAVGDLVLVCFTDRRA